MSDPFLNAPGTVGAVIVAAGSGARLADGGPPKQYRMLAGRAVLARTLDAFIPHPAIERIVVVIRDGDDDLYRRALDGPDPGPRLLPPVTGGATRQASVRQGLEALAAAGCSKVLIHDAARPFITPAAISAVIDAVSPGRGAIAATPLTDTLKRGDGAGRILDTLPRDGLWRAQTPQGFMLDDILAAHRRAAGGGRSDFTDDAAVAEWAGLAVGLVDAGEGNMKITTAADLAMAEARCVASMQPDVRTGQGYDVHRLQPGDHVWLCGVRIAHDRSLEGHSDADVGLHAATDALLGAIGDGDIGQHFRNDDPRWRGARSSLFLADAARRVRERGGRIMNIDVTLICEAPKVGPHREAMRRAVAEAAGITWDRVGVKATTNERLGFLGRGEGIAAIATATVALST